MTLSPIAHIETDFATKFGVPRQSMLVENLRGRIVFAPAYRNAEALRGLEGYSHLWLLWHFNQAQMKPGEWHPTVRPPRLGGNVRMGVWATRSPFRPNPIGLSSVRLVDITLSSPRGPIIEVEGVDMVSGTPILDIKPYLPFTDSHPTAQGGFAQQQLQQFVPLKVIIPPAVEQIFTPSQLQSLRAILAANPRPQYQCDPTRIYTLSFAGKEIHFRIEDNMVIVVE